MSTVSLSQPKMPPLTAGLPLFGSMPQLLKENLNFFIRAREQHGDIFTLNLGVTSMVIICTPEMADYVMRKNAKNFGRGGAVWDSVRTLIGTGLAASDGDHWLHQRQMLQPHFHRQSVSAMTDLMLDAIEIGLQQWEPWAGSDTPVDFVKAFNHVTISIIVRTIFGNRLSKDDADSLSHNLGYAVDRILPNMIGHFLPQWMPFPGRKKYQRAIKDIDAVLHRIIQERRQDTESQNDVLGMLMHMVDAETGIPMSDQQVRDEAATLFLGGYETSASTLAWSIHLLTRTPHVMAKLTAEIDSVLGSQRPTFETMMHLPYTRMVIQEILRIRPAVYWLPRAAIEEDEVNGYHIAAGQMIGVSIYNIHHDPKLWENPEVFDPERFSPERAEKRHHLAWMPFGAGQHLCLGRDLALMQSTLLLAMMVQRYTFAPTDHVPAMSLSTVLRPQDGIWATLSKRA